MWFLTRNWKGFEHCFTNNEIPADCGNGCILNFFLQVYFSEAILAYKKFIFLNLNSSTHRELSYHRRLPLRVTAVCNLNELSFLFESNATFQTQVKEIKLCIDLPSNSTT